MLVLGAEVSKVPHSKAVGPGASPGRKINTPGNYLAVAAFGRREPNFRMIQFVKRHSIAADL
jgi:hypothetical protein